MKQPSPLLLLIGTGTMLGLNFPLGKMALTQGVNPALWAAFISFGAGLALLFLTLYQERGQLRPDRTLKFSLISGFLSYVMPNFLTFTVIPKIGSGLAAIMFALSPVATALISIIFGVRPPNKWGLVGIGVGLLGAGLIISGRNTNIEINGKWWILVALLVPLFLALGNVYRTSAWPNRASPHRLAAYTNLAAVPFLMAIAAVDGFTLAPLYTMQTLLILQFIVSTCMFLMFFKLQQIGGPTYLSQIGYVAAAVGLVIGVTVFGEIYPFSVCLGAGVIVSGIVLSTLASSK
jgi:drug/metabolite transporter (DMT)-like permease